jgi:hypothetical protein
MMNDALNSLWKEAKHYCGIFVEELMKTMKGLSQDILRTGRDSKRELSEFKSRTSSPVGAIKLMLTQVGCILLTNSIVGNPAHTITNLEKAI